VRKSEDSLRKPSSKDARFLARKQELLEEAKRAYI
jgi:hypothetical protein